MLLLVITTILAQTSASAAPTRPLTTHETQETYRRACKEYKRTQDPRVIAVDIGGRQLGTLSCEDYDPPGFDAWYKRTAKRLGLSLDPDDPAHCYDYRAFYLQLRAGVWKAPKRGERFPSNFELACHKSE